MYTTYRYHCCCFKSLSHVQLFVTQWTVDCQTPLSMGLPRQEYWRGLPFSSPGDLPNSGIKCASPALAGGFFTTEPSGKLTYRYISLVVLRFYTHTHTHTHTHTQQHFQKTVIKPSYSLFIFLNITVHVTALLTHKSCFAQ